MNMARRMEVAPASVSVLWISTKEHHYFVAFAFSFAPSAILTITLVSVVVCVLWSTSFLVVSNCFPLFERIMVTFEHGVHS